MADYQVPQFIEVEDKIFGPFTLKQFVYVAGGVGLCTILVLYFPLIIGIILALPVAALTAALAFYKVNNKPFVEIAEAALKFYVSDRLFLWKKEQPRPGTQAQQTPVVEAPAPQKLGLTQSRLRDLSISLDTQDTQQNPPQ